jgi:esterase/lipase superfamily enzyme
VEIEIVGMGKYTAGEPYKVSAAQERALWQRQVPVLFGTTRTRTASNDPDDFYSDTTDAKVDVPALRLGRAVVQIPLAHTRGNVERPDWMDKLLAAIFKKNLNDPTKFFGIASDIEELTDQDLLSDLRQAMQGSASKSAIVYVHGFANDFTDAMYRVAQLSYDLRADGYDAVPLLFSWPSDYVKVDYLSAKDRVEHAAQHLRLFLEKVSAAQDLGAIHIVGHSMGTHVEKCRQNGAIALSTGGIGCGRHSAQRVSWADSALGE